MNKIVILSLVALIAFVQCESADDEMLNDLEFLTSPDADSFLESMEKRLFSSKKKTKKPTKEEKARQKEAKNEVAKQKKRKERMARAYKTYEDTCETQKNIAQRSCLKVKTCQMNGSPITKEASSYSRPSSGRQSPSGGYRIRYSPRH
ncbi:hypothetical protein SNEBB_002940 [Seison nebaliae]|nr:hypothetical protein SNEBB_002940 [Seison nebaliae]